MRNVRAHLRSGFFTASFLALAIGCGSSSSSGGATAGESGGGSSVNGSGSASGTIGGKSLSVSAAFSANETTSKTFGEMRSGQVGTVVLTDTVAVCSDASNSDVPKGASLLVIQLYTNDDDAGTTVMPAFDTGTYDVRSGTDDTGPQAMADFYQPGAICGPESMVGATAGSVTVSTVNADGSYAGTYDLTFGSDHATGSFASVACNDVAKILQTTPSCD